MLQRWHCPLLLLDTVDRHFIFAALNVITLKKFHQGDYNFNMSSINRQLNHPFVLATSSPDPQMSRGKHIQHTLNAYLPILQPRVWAQWVSTLVWKVLNNYSIVTPFLYPSAQDLVNAAVIKYTKIANKSPNSTFGRSLNSIIDDIVAQFIVGQQKAAPKTQKKRRTIKKPRDSPTVPPVL
jgi:hypothetical protein